MLRLVQKTTRVTTQANTRQYETTRVTKQDKMSNNTKQRNRTRVQDETTRHNTGTA